MSENVFAPSADETSSLKSSRALKTILYGGLAVGVLDGLWAVILSGRRGVGPIRVFQFISSGLFGRSAFSGGVRAALLGLLIHFMIATTLAAIYYGASKRLPMLVRQAVLWGVLYGFVVYLVMNYVVLPLSAAPPLPSSIGRLLVGLIGHALVVGLPISLIARRCAKNNLRDRN
ncbi:MAG TPA: hypothetical protein VF074_23620 [Pyrinomonadaceae bacterium]